MINLKIKKSNINYIIFALIIVFADILDNGNLNLLYFLGFWLFIKSFYKKEFWNDLIKLFIPFLMIPIIYILFGTEKIILSRGLVYVTKIFINISLFSYFKNNFKKMNVYKEIDIISILYFLIFILALLTFQSRSLELWRYNDAYNDFSKTRLQLFFSEPSVLGFNLCICLVFIFYNIFQYGLNRKKILETSLLLFLLVLTFSISAILYLSCAVAFLLLSIFNRKNTFRKQILLYILFFFFLVFLIMFTNNAIHDRIDAILHGKDASYNFRWTLSYNSLLEILDKTNNLGLGLSNMNSENGEKILLTTGIDYKFANSFMYFIAENGFLGLIYILYIFFICIKYYKIDKKNKLPEADLKMALIIVCFASQIAGGYFTDPTIWSIYGIICSKFNFNELCMEKKV